MYNVTLKNARKIEDSICFDDSLKYMIISLWASNDANEYLFNYMDKKGFELKFLTFGSAVFKKVK